MDAIEELVMVDAAAWRAWLAATDDGIAAVWLVLAKKGTLEPTSLTYDEALQEALCHGWIDGQVRRRDEATFKQRFTRRRPRSSWSKRNVGIVEQLIAEDRMQPRGLAEVERAKTDGRWELAYAGPASIEVPDELAKALARLPAARATFEALSGQNRYAILYRIATAKRPETRTRRIEQFVAMLARGETVHPQRDGPTPRPRAGDPSRDRRSGL